ncbi:MAG: TIM-barrel domain-containing protein, partial [Bacteroidota bacterium]
MRRLLFALLCLALGSPLLAQPVLTRVDTSLTGTFAQYKITPQGLTIIHTTGAEREKKTLSVPFRYLGAEIEARKIGYKMGTFSFKTDEQARFMGLDSTALARFSATDSADFLTINGLLLDPKRPSRRATISLMLEVRADETVLFMKPGSEKINVFHISLGKANTTDIFGGGEQAPHVKLTGHRVPVFCEEQGIGRGDQPITRWLKLAGVAGDEWTSYKPLPYFVTTDKRALQVQAVRKRGEEATAKVIADFTHERRMHFEIWSDDTTVNMARIVIRHRDKPLDLVGTFVEKNLLPPLPDWAYGTWMGLQGGRSAVSGWVAAAQRAGNPVRALWIQDWSGRRKTRFGSQLWWRWMPDKSIYFDFRQFLRQMKADSVFVLGYVNQFLADEGGFYGTAKQRGYLVKNAKGEDYEIKTPGFPAVLVDLFNPEAYNWLKRTIQEQMIDPGMYGWMADYGEWLPEDAYVYNADYHPDSGHTKYVKAGLSGHNQYPMLWAKLNYEAVKERGMLDSIVFFTRSGWVGSEDYSTAFWAGDQMVDW